MKTDFSTIAKEWLLRMTDDLFEQQPMSVTDCLRETIKNGDVLEKTTEQIMASANLPAKNLINELPAFIFLQIIKRQECYC